MKEFNLGLIGLGNQGKLHLRNCLNMEGVKVLAASDISKKTLSIAKRMGVKNVYDDYDKLLDNDEVDAVIISLPNFLHLESTIRSLEAGKDVFLEKPLARDVNEGNKILSAVRRSGRRLMVGYPLRFLKTFIDIRDGIISGHYGEVQIVDASNVSHGPFSSKWESSGPSPVPSWWFDKELTGGGALLDLGSHLVNLLTWYFGEVVYTKSYLAYRFNMDSEDLAMGILKFSDGPTAVIKAGWFSMDHSLSVQVYGTAKNEVVNIKMSSLRLLWNAIRQKFGRFDHDPFFKELRYFVNCLRDDTLPIPSAEDGASDLRVISMLYENSARLT